MLVGVVTAGMLVGYGVVAKAWPAPYYEGYFGYGSSSSPATDIFPTNSDTSGCEGDGSSIPAWVTGSADVFINFILCKLNSTNSYGPYRNMEVVGAAFIIQTMRGGTDRAFPDGADIYDWAQRVRYYDSRGWINWGANYSYSYNTYYMGTYNGSAYVDDAFGPWPGSAPSIVFSDGVNTYGIRRPCANPVGTTMSGLTVPWYATGRTTVTSGATTSTSNINVAAGTSVTFKHYINNYAGPNAGGYTWNTFGRNEATTPWTAQYYNNTNLSGSPVVTRSEQDVSYHDPVGNVAPAPGVNADGFSARWTRAQTFPAGNYWFTMRIDDGGRLFIDGVKVLESWTGQGATPYSYYRAALPAGTHTFTFEYYEGGGPGWADLEYTNYNPAGGYDNVPYAAGEDKLITAATETYNIPAAAAPGTQICRQLWYNWKNWMAQGDYGLAAAAFGPMVCATVASTITSSCGGATINVSPPDPAEASTITAVVNTTGGQPGAAAVDAASNFYFRLKRSNGTIVTQSGNYTPLTIGGSASSSGTGTITAAVGIGPTNAADTYTVEYGMASGLGSVDCTWNFVAAYSPFFAVRGGDVAAGPGFGSACTPSMSGITAKNTGGGGGRAYYGAGTELGAFALGQINGFASNTTLNSATGIGASTAGGTATQPSGLAFSNTLTGGSIYGTNFGKDPTDAPGNSWCAPDYYGTAWTAATGTLTPTAGVYTLSQAALNGLTSGGTYKLTGNLQTTGPLQLGGAGNPTRMTIVVNGDAYLNSATIGYAAYSYTSGVTSPAAIPQLQIIVQGNIYIDLNVGTMSGFYVAQPNGGSGGNI